MSVPEGHLFGYCTMVYERHDGEDGERVMADGGTPNNEGGILCTIVVFVLHQLAMSLSIANSVPSILNTFDTGSRTASTQRAQLSGG